MTRSNGSTPGKLVHIALILNHTQIAIPQVYVHSKASTPTLLRFLINIIGFFGSSVNLFFIVILIIIAIKSWKAFSALTFSSTSSAASPESIKSSPL
mmetsp:Transcript_22689/g.34915  ORF Transcript_22689/g.34915 Transcript_22689/m.34915 type:complete len:97 (-) Transcript_22689:296-586(-)